MFKRILSVAAVVGAIITISLPGLAAAAPAGQGLEISPPLIELKADPGKTVTTQIKVRNVTQQTLVVRAEFDDFIANDESGAPKLLLKEDEKSPYSLKDWLQTPDQLTLKPAQQQAVTLQIVVPANASPGGHYGVVRFTGTPPEIADTGVSLSASVGTLLLVNVSGNVKQSAKIAEVYTSQNKVHGGFFETGPVTVTTRVQNTGNVHFKPRGTVQITNTFGKNVYVGQFNPTERNVLPSSIRKFNNEFAKKNLFGKYKVNVDVVYGTENQIASSQVTFWVIPYKLIIITLVLIAGIIIVFKNYNKYIISKSQKKSSNGRGKNKK